MIHQLLYVLILLIRISGYFISTAVLFISTNVFSDEYIIDTEGAHAFIQFKISHLGYRWMRGRLSYVIPQWKRVLTLSG